MPSRPASIMCLLQPFAALFAAPTWRKVQVWRVGAMLAPGKRTVSSALQVWGLHEQRDFARYPHVLSRAVSRLFSGPALRMRILDPGNCTGSGKTRARRPSSGSVSLMRTKGPHGLSRPLQQSLASPTIQGYPQWSDPAILRTTPAWLGLFSWRVLATHVLHQGKPVADRRSAWYTQKDPTFSDVLAFMRPTLWRQTHFFGCPPSRPTTKNLRNVRLPRLWMPFATLRDCTKSS